MEEPLDVANADAMADAALALLHTGDAEGAAERLSRLVDRYPEIDRYRYRLALALSRLNAREAALTNFRAAIALHPGFGLFHQSYISELAKAAAPGAIGAGYAELGGFDGLSRDLQVHAAMSLAEAGASLEQIASLSPDLLGADVDGESEPTPRGVVRLICGAKRLAVATSPTFARTPMFVERLISFAPYFQRFADMGGAIGEHVDLCVDDLPPQTTTPVLCFSGYEPHHILVPDSAFLGSNAYAHMHAMAARDGQHWAARKPMAYWRGTLTGLAGSREEVEALPRFRLCSLSHRALDARITGTAQFAHLNPALDADLRDRGMLGDREPERLNFGYRFMIDVDGNSNSWPGLYLKLVTGGCVLKLMTPWRQWYYPRMEAGRHVLAAESIEGLVALLDWCLANDSAAEAVGRAGRDLAVSMTLASEFPHFVTAWRQAAASG